MQIFAQPSKNSMFANITCIARDNENDHEISQLVKIAMPPNVVMELKARKLYCNSDGHPPSDILYYDTDGNEVESKDGKNFR